ncbi:MAG TPA: hypothetical protein VGB20_07285 [bacterium]
MPAKPARPRGITMLAVLHTIGGVLLVLILPLAIRRAPQAADALGIAPPLVVLSLGVLAALALASAAGMWLGTAWGWWWTAAYYCYAVLRGLSALLVLPALAAAGAPSADLARAALKHGGRILISVLLLLYLFRPHVEGYFGVRAYPVRSRLLKLAGWMAMLLAAGWLLARAAG